MGCTSTQPWRSCQTVWRWDIGRLAVNLRPGGLWRRQTAPADRDQRGQTLAGGLRSLRRAGRANLPDTRLVYIAGRECDIHAFMIRHLLTNRAVATLTQAIELIQWYGTR